MSKIEFNHYDLFIKELANGNEVIQIKSSVAFDESLIAELKEKGVRELPIKQEEEEETNGD